MRWWVWFFCFTFGFAATFSLLLGAIITAAAANGSYATTERTMSLDSAINSLINHGEGDQRNMEALGFSSSLDQTGSSRAGGWIGIFFSAAG